MIKGIINLKNCNVKIESEDNIKFKAVLYDYYGDCLIIQGSWETVMNVINKIIE